MTSKHILAITAFVILAAAGTPAYAGADFRSSFGLKAQFGDSERNEKKDTEKNRDRGERDNWSDEKRWDTDMRADRARRMGVFGTVTAQSSTSLTIKESKTNTVYTVDIRDADIKTPGNNNTALVVGDSVLVRGAINGNSIDATMVIDMRGPKEVQIKKDMTGIVGVVTDISGTTLTIEGKNDIVYTVDTADARIRRNGDDSAKLSNIEREDTVVVQGTLTGKTIDAVAIVAIDDDTVADIKAEIKKEGKGGFFHRLGLFFKDLFGKKD